jgi:hypothetical protein
MFLIIISTRDLRSPWTAGGVPTYIYEAEAPLSIQSGLWPDDRKGALGARA